MTIERIEGLPGHVVGLSASGRVTAEDYESVAIPAVEAAIAAHGRIRVLYEVAGDFNGFSPEAMWDDLRLGVSHLGSWERVALVTDVPWLRHAAGLFRFMMPCPVRVFDADAAQQARDWLLADRGDRAA